MMATGAMARGPFCGLGAHQAGMPSGGGAAFADFFRQLFAECFEIAGVAKPCVARMATRLPVMSCMIFSLSGVEPDQRREWACIPRGIEHGAIFRVRRPALGVRFIACMSRNLLPLSPDMRQAGLPMTEPNSLDDPVRRARVVRMLLIASPFMFAGCYALAAVQGAEGFYALVIALAGTGMSLGTALVIHLMGSKSKWALIVVQIVLMLVAAKR